MFKKILQKMLSHEAVIVFMNLIEEEEVYMKNLLGIYEKALPQDISLKEKLCLTKKLGFDFFEISIDETDEKLNRLYYTDEKLKDITDAIYETKISIPTMCFSGHRKYPLGSRNLKTREKSLEIMEKAIDFASKIGIRVIQLAGYDVYYEKGGEDTKKLFIENLYKCVKMAERRQVMLSIETMDTEFINSITKYMEYDEIIKSPWLTVYPDIGNLTAWNNDVEAEIRKGIHRITAVHLKETKAVTDSFKGQFREVTFGEGCVDFIKILSVLKELDYSGTFLIEMWGAKYDDPEKEIIKAKEWIIDKLQKSGL